MQKIRIQIVLGVPEGIQLSKHQLTWDIAYSQIEYIHKTKVYSDEYQALNK